MLQTAFGTSCMNRASVFEWHKRSKESREFVGDDERGERSKDVNTPELIGQTDRVSVRVTILRFWGSSGRDFVGRGQHSSNRVSGISARTMHQSTTPSLSQTIWPRWASGQLLGFTPCDFYLFPKVRGCRYETIVEMKEAVRKVIDTLTLEDFHGSFQKVLGRYNKCIAAWRRFGRRGLEFHVCTINKNAYTKKVWKLI